MGLGQASTYFPFTSRTTNEVTSTSPCQYSPLSFKNPQPATQHVWGILGGPARNWGRQPGPMKCPQGTGGVIFMRAMSFASEPEEYFS